MHAILGKGVSGLPSLASAAQTDEGGLEWWHVAIGGGIVAVLALIVVLFAIRGTGGNSDQNRPGRYYHSSGPFLYGSGGGGHSDHSGCGSPGGGDGGGGS